jgi:hypothetical protein
MAEQKPKGSGWFSVGVGALFVGVFICSLIWDLSKIAPYTLFKVWVFIAASILLTWGVRRIKTGRNDPTIGQSTINFVIAIVGLTVAILAIVMDSGKTP